MKIFPNPNRSQVYIVMEWLEGKLLTRILNEEKSLSLDRATKLTLHICAALEYVHGHGVVLRDLSPESIMVDSDDNIKLFSFGFAAMTGARRVTFAILPPPWAHLTTSLRSRCRARVETLAAIFIRLALSSIR